MGRRQGLKTRRNGFPARGLRGPRGSWGSPWVARVSWAPPPPPRGVWGRAGLGREKCVEGASSVFHIGWAPPLSPAALGQRPEPGAVRCRLRPPGSAGWTGPKAPGSHGQILTEDVT